MEGMWKKQPGIENSRKLTTTELEDLDWSKGYRESITSRGQRSTGFQKGMNKPQALSES